MPEEDLDALVRRVDPDRWLAARFIEDPARRAVVIGVYALNYELAKVGESVTQPLAGEIRLAWWRERLEEMAAGRSEPGHPILDALRARVADGSLPLGLLDALVEARHADVDSAPFADDAALEHYIARTAGAVMALAARALDPEVDPGLPWHAACAWGYAGLFRALPFWRERGRRWAPASWGDPNDAELARRVRERVDAALAAARAEAAGLPVAAFPAIAYATLARPYARGRKPGALETRARLVRAVATGRV
jgi:15-cis-phytoene synthase